MSALDNQEIANLFVSNFASVYSSGLIANMIATPISIIITSYCLRAKFRNLYLNWAQEQRVVWMRSHFCLLRTVLFNLLNPWPFYSTDLFRQETSPILPIGGRTGRSHWLHRFINPGDKSDNQNYHPVSIIHKCFEKLVYDKISHYSSPLIIDIQFGFMSSVPQGLIFTFPSVCLKRAPNWLSRGLHVQRFFQGVR